MDVSSEATILSVFCGKYSAMQWTNTACWCYKNNTANLFYFYNTVVCLQGGKVSILGVEVVWGNCRDIPTYHGS